MKKLLQLLLVILVSYPLQAQMPNSSKKLVFGLGAGTYSANQISGVSGIFDLTHEEKNYFYKFRLIANREVELSLNGEDFEDYNAEVALLTGWLSEGRNFKVAISTGIALVSGQEIKKGPRKKKYTVPGIPAQVEAKVKLSSNKNIGFGFALNVNEEQSFTVFFVKLNMRS